MFSIRVCTVGRDPLSVMSVGKASGGVHTLLGISDFTLERNPISVMNVEKSFFSTLASLNIRCFTWARKMKKMAFVRKHIVGI